MITAKTANPATNCIAGNSNIWQHAIQSATLFGNAISGNRQNTNKRSTPNECPQQQYQYKSQYSNNLYQ
jgi:hypothetical protein